MQDGGRAGQDLPLLAILRRWRSSDDDPIEWMLLTHPHEDHADGFAELVDALPPERIGLMGPPPPGRALLDEIRSSAKYARLTEQALKRSQVLAAAKAIERWQHDSGCSVSALHDGSVLEGLSGVEAHVRAPDPRRASALLEKGWPTLRRRANELNLVIEIVFGQARIVLGGDLPVRQAGGAAARTGWNTVMMHHPQLSRASGLKVPHHASRDALHVDLIAHRRSLATWVTPYSRGRLPDPGEGGGLHMLLDSGATVLLSALPTRRESQEGHPHPARFSRSEYRDLTETPATGNFLADAIDITPPAIPDARSPIWATAFDEEGRIVEKWRGAHALEIVP